MKTYALVVQYNLEMKVPNYCILFIIYSCHHFLLYYYYPEIFNSIINMGVDNGVVEDFSPVRFGAI